MRQCYELTTNPHRKRLHNYSRIISPGRFNGGYGRVTELNSVYDRGKFTYSEGEVVGKKINGRSNENERKGVLEKERKITGKSNGMRD